MINEKKCHNLRDSSSTLIGVHTKLVKKEDYTADYITCRTFTGTKEKYHILLVSFGVVFCVICLPGCI